jgi:hypothetical protein
MASKKASVGDRAEKFLASIGTAGGPIGSPALVGFGGQDILQQLKFGVADQYAPIREAAEAPVIGKPNQVQPSLPRDLDAAYLKLNLPGSPLPRNGLLTPQFLDSAQFTQDAIIANEQLLMANAMPPTGQLPVVIQPPVPQKKGRR